jgi:hypothetical protein
MMARETKQARRRKMDRFVFKFTGMKGKNVVNATYTAVTEDKRQQQDIFKRDFEAAYPGVRKVVAYSPKLAEMWCVSAYTKQHGDICRRSGQFFVSAYLFPTEQAAAEEVLRKAAECGIVEIEVSDCSFVNNVF